MDNQVEKVYVAPGNDLSEGFKTLDWALAKWKQKPISIVLLHVSCNTSVDFVQTPFGKLPASSVSEEKLELLRSYEQGKMDILLSKYIAFSGKVKAEILKIERSDEAIQNVIVDLILRRKITKMVIGITFMKSSAWKSKNAISGSFYIHQHKPNFCELFILCGGKLVFLKGEDEDAIMEDDQGVIVAKKANFTCWRGKRFLDHYHYPPGRQSSPSLPLSRSLDLTNGQNEWEFFAQDIDTYFEHLLSLNLDEEIVEDQNESLQIGSMEAEGSENADPSISVAEKTEYCRRKMDEAQKIILLNREEAKANAERSAKAERAVLLCNGRVEELEGKIKEEVTSRIELSKNLDVEKERIQEMMSDMEESKSRLSSLSELQSELSNKLQMSSLARTRVQAQLEKAVAARGGMVREIEELRRQRDVLQRRIEFCKEKDAIGMATKLSEESCGYREYSADDIRSATDNFSERLRLKSCGNWTNIYRGRINHLTVAIKRFTSDIGLSQENFLAKVKTLSNIRHPHLVAIVGFCSELECVIYEYMHHGSLRDILFSSQSNNRKRNQILTWQDRIRVAHEVCTGLGFLHSTKPKPTFHGRLTTSSILLDRNLAAKITGFGLLQSFEERGVRLDIRAFGVLLLHLLTGRNWAGLGDEAMAVDRASLTRVLDEMAGQWRLDLAEELIAIAVKCLSITRGPNPEISLLKIRERLGDIRKRADETAGKVVKAGVDRQDSDQVPSFFLCPIFQDLMKNPHVAADGFSYEREAIEEWLNMGRDTSPMTNLRLPHKFLTPNHTLRSLIQEWQNKPSDLQ